jgi:hypothetical protein
MRKFLGINHILKEVTLRVLVMYSPPVVHEYVKQREEDDEESSGPLGFEPDRYHDASRKTNQREDYTGKIPFPLKGHSNEQEDQENSSS